MKKAISALLLAGTISGCGHTPSVVKGVDLTDRGDTTTASDERQTKYATAAAGTTLALPAIPIERNRTALEKQLEAYAQSWRQQEGELLLRRDIGANLQVGASLATARNVLKDNLPVAKHWAALFALIGLDDKTFKVVAQSANYGEAAAAFQCVERKLRAVPMDAWDYLDPKKGSPVISFAAGQSDELKRLHALFPDINDSLNAIQTKLQVLQRAETINVPSADAVVKALKQAADEAKATRDSLNAPDTQDNLRFLAQIMSTDEKVRAAATPVKRRVQYFSKGSSPVDVALLEALLELPSKVKSECVTPFAGG